MHLASTLSVLADSNLNCYYLAKYFCGGRIARFGPRWASLRDNSSPSANMPTSFFTGSLGVLEKLARLPDSFVFSSKNIYRELLKELSSPPILPRFWSPFLRPSLDMAKHWSLVHDSIMENFENDLSWLITLKAVKVRESLRNQGYINSDLCATCPRREIIDHCFLNCTREKFFWGFFYSSTFIAFGSVHIFCSDLCVCVFLSFPPLRC